MKHYALQQNEVLMFQGTAYRNNEKFFESEILLTNLYLVIITHTKKIFSKEETNVESFPVQDIKMYNNIPQIKQEGSIVEIYLLSHEEKLDFLEKKEARKFIHTAFELLTGKSFTERSANKVENAIGLVDKTLGINTVNTVKNVIENGMVGTVVGGIKHRKSGKIGIASIASDALNLAKSNIFNQNQYTRSETHALESQSNSVTDDISSFDDKMNALKKLKELLDADIITQEEFDAKKADLLAKM